MTTTDANGIAYVEDTDPVSPLNVLLNTLQASTSNAFDASIRIFPVANTTERAALVADRSPSSSNPLFVYRIDAGAGKQLEYTINGTTWISVRGAQAPYIRMYVPASQAVSPGAWTKVSNLTGVGELQNSTFTASGGTITLVTGGVFSFDASLSMNGANFAIRIHKVETPTPKVLAQSTLGVTVSQTNSTSSTDLLAAGDQVELWVYCSTALTVAANTLLTPSHLKITKISD